MLTYDEGKNHLKQHPKGALADFRAIASQEPKNPVAQYWLGVCYFRGKMFSQAEEQFRKAISLGVGSSETGNFHYYLGLSLERQQRLAEANQAFQATLALAPNYKLAAEKLGVPLASDPRPVTAPPVTAAPESSPVQPAAAKPAPTSASSSLAADLATLGKDAGPGEELFAKRRTMRTFYSSFFVGILGILGIAYFALVEQLVAPLLLCLLVGGTSWLLAFLRSRASRYTFFERRIDIAEGVLFRRFQSVWLYEIIDVEYSRGPLELLMATGRITIQTKGHQFRLVGLGNGRRMKKLWATLRDTVLFERREMKQVWID